MFVTCPEKLYTANVQNVGQKVNLRSYLEIQARRNLNATNVTTGLAWMSYDDTIFPLIGYSKFVYIFYLRTIEAEAETTNFKHILAHFCF
jgi:hypothetical protein